MVSFGQPLLLFGGPQDGRSVYKSAAIQTARLSELLSRHPSPGPQRVGCHVIILVSTGQGTHALDFATYNCRPGTLLWGRPGQVHQFGRQSGFDATLLAFPAETIPEVPELAPLARPVGDPCTNACWQLTGEDEEAIVAEVAQIAVDCARYGPDRLGGALLAHQLAVLLMRVAALAPPPPLGPAAATLNQLRAELEREVRHRRVEDYADRMRCSVRTLTRACLASTGRSAKQLIDERVALEAKRLLATTDLPVAEVGRLLGFEEPTNFGRFFAREAGQSPGAFRVTVTRALAPRIPAQRSALPGRIARS